MKRRLITSALPYVNNEPHLGNLIQVLSADAFARFCRLRGYETCYVCGTDEYGTATETRALEEGVSPRELCDRYWEIHSRIYRWFNIEFDKFGRTSTPIHTEVTQDIFRRLDEAGFITEKTMEQLYCPACERFLADRYVRGDCPHCGYDGARGDQCEKCGKLLEPTELKAPRCSSCGTKPLLKSTKHLYIDLPKLRGRLETWIDVAAARGKWARNAVQMTKSWIRDGLHERAITRDLKWGIPVPKEGFENKVFYVWFDAPIGYVSITGALGEERGQDWKRFINYWWKDPENVELFQFIGKDNIPFHTVIFPSTQLGADQSDGQADGKNWTMLHHMSSTEYLNYETGKFSKSNGIGVFGTDAMETGIPADVWRFYIFYNRPEKSDALFVWKDFGEKVNAELIGNFGNLVNRTLSFVTRYYDGLIPLAEEREREKTERFWEKAREYETAITEKLEWAELRDAFHLIFELSSFANKTFQDGEPWRTRKDDPPAASELIRNLTFLVRDLAVLASPFIPEAAEKVAGFFAGGDGKPVKPSWKELGKTEGVERVVKSAVLFERLPEERMAELRERYSGAQAERPPAYSETSAVAGGILPRSGRLVQAGLPAVTENDIEKRFNETVDLRVAKIVKVEKHPKADKLYIETLDIAGEERVIVSGLVPFYREEELLGRHIIVVYNLKPAKLRGVESRGMLLAASLKTEDGEIVEVLDGEGVETGTQAHPEGFTPPDAALPEIDIDTFSEIPITVRQNTVYIGGLALCLNGKPVKTARIENGDVH
ncbi:MAG: methionine--tRNA ligase [Spirochaetaceae bacterium]|jgi:methionyl-tRNA synthetase|nr:methionine--tRNA ligase [Spirochaetaceae bacterium]